MKSKIAIFSILLCLASLLPAKNNVNITVKLKNGDVVTGKADLPNLSISSAYGNLKIPIEKITNLKLGIVSDHTKDGAVLPDLNKLQTVSETDAKSIYERLLGYGTPILATVINFTENPFYQISSVFLPN